MADADTTRIAQLGAALAGRYDVQGELGRGGMATVYRAWDVKHGRQVAIKVLKPELAATVGGDRFLREIRIAAQLQHPHVLMLIDSGEAEGLLYYVMPWVDGESLRERIDREGALPVDESVRLAREVADALSYAHSQGVVHRDIKPENIMLSRGHALVMDFGISRVFGEVGAVTLTDTSMALGTPAYMSPEQWSGTKIDARTDVYSLGCVLYEMLVGEPPFRGPTIQAVMARHSMEAVPSIRVVRPAVPEALEAVVTRALAKVPADRYQTIAQLAEALASAIGPAAALGTTPALGVPVTPVLDATTQPGLRTARATRFGLGRLALRAGIALAVLAAAAGAWLLRPGARDGAAGAAAVDTDRIVIGEFENLTRDPSLVDLGRIPVDWITLSLQRTNLPVVSSPTAVQASQYVRRMATTDSSIDRVRALAREAGARYVLTGSFRLFSDTVEFQAHLMDTYGSGPAGTLINSLDPISAPASDPREGIDLLRQRVVALLLAHFEDRVPTTAETMGQPPTLESYRRFSDGMEKYASNRFRDALASFEEAFRLDSTSVLALLYAALCHNNLNQWAQADSLSRVAEGLSDQLTDFHRAWLGYIRGQVAGDRELALREIQRAVDLDPESKASYNLAWVALQTNRPQLAYDALRNLRPDEGPMRGWFQYWAVLTDALHRLGEHNTELAEARKARSAWPGELRSLRLEAEALAARGRTAELTALLDTALIHGGDSVAVASLLHGAAVELREHGEADAANAVLTRALQWFDTLRPEVAAAPAYRSWRAAVLGDLGRLAEAEALIEELARETGTPFHRGWLGHLRARQDDREAALAIDAWLASLQTPYSFGANTLQRARIHARLGDGPRAIELLGDAFREGQPIPRHLDPNFDALRGDPALARLIAPRK